MNYILKALKKLEEISNHKFTIEIFSNGSCGLNRYDKSFYDGNIGKTDDYDNIESLLTEMNNIIAGKNEWWLED